MDHRGIAPCGKASYHLIARLCATLQAAASRRPRLHRRSAACPLGEPRSRSEGCGRATAAEDEMIIALSDTQRQRESEREGRERDASDRYWQMTRM